MRCLITLRMLARLTRRQIHTHQPLRQVEALGLIVDAAEKVNEDAKSEANKPKRKRLRRAGNGNGGSGGNSGGSNGNNGNNGSQNKEWKRRVRETFVKAAETAVIMTSGLAMLGFAGLLYHKMYRHHTLRKMEYAFDSFDPVLEMSTGQLQTQMASRMLNSQEESPLDSSSSESLSESTDQPCSETECESSDWVERPQQKLLDDIIAGRAGGRYYVLLGEKGTGKTSMLLHALQDVKGYNVVVVDAHSDPEIFRQRLGKALHFEFYEDYWGGLFSLRGPRENTFLDIERVFNVLEEVSVRRFKKLGRPVVLVINSAHLIPEDEDGKKLLILLQQKAEALSGSGVATMLFNSDDYWLYQRLARIQTRMDAISVSDLAKPEALKVLRSLRRRVRNSDTHIEKKENDAEISDSLADTIYHLVGGRPQHLAAVAGHDDMVAASQRLIDREKQWFLNNCALLGPDMDDDVMDSGKFSVSGMKLAREFVRLEKESQQSLVNPKDGSQLLPRIPLWRARQVMTRPDFMREYDNLNLFTLDSESRVKPDSVVMMHAFREIVSLPGFEELLEATDGRVSDIESLGRTKELTFKDLGGGGGADSRGSLVLHAVGDDGKPSAKYKVELELPEDEDYDEEALALDSAEKYYWKKRLKKQRESAV